MSTNRRNRVDALLIIGGLVSILVTGAVFAIFPMYQLLDMSVVRRPIWDPPRIVIREALQGLSAEDVARMEQAPRQKELVDKLREPIVFEPKPSWLGRRKPELNKPVTGRQYPPNKLLYLFVGSVVVYIYALKRRGIL